VIEGATEESYRVVAADEGQKLACRVTALNEEGSASAESAAVEVAGNAPVRPARRRKSSATSAWVKR